MFRNLAIATAAALTLGAGVASAPAPAAAQSVNVRIGHPGYHNARYVDRRVVVRKHCRVKKVVSRNKWGKRVVRTVRTCR
jgi:hypothetical protein